MSPTASVVQRKPPLIQISGEPRCFAPLLQIKTLAPNRPLGPWAKIGCILRVGLISIHGRNVVWVRWRSSSAKSKSPGNFRGFQPRERLATVSKNTAEVHYDLNTSYSDIPSGASPCLRYSGVIKIVNPNHEKNFIWAYFPAGNFTLIWQKGFLRMRVVRSAIYANHEPEKAAGFPANDWKGRTWPTPLKRLGGTLRNLLKS